VSGDIVTKVRPGGLRYQSKTTGTDFPGPYGATMSCILCGRHLLRTRLVAFKLAGSRQFRCKDGC
jgi:hypothetical protein